MAGPHPPLERKHSLQHLWDVFLAEAQVTQEEAESMPDQEWDELLQKKIPDEGLRKRIQSMRDDLLQQADAELRRHNPHQQQNYGCAA